MMIKLFARIAPLFDVGLLSEARVLIAGCGSGGGQVALQLAMSGVRKFVLFDSDVLEAENVIRHVCGRRYLGQLKVDAVADVLLDRNPALEIERHNVDLMTCADLADQVRAQQRRRACDGQRPDPIPPESVVRGDQDRRSSSARSSPVASAAKCSAIVPERAAVWPALKASLSACPYRDGVREIDLVSDEEREKMYGMEIAEIKDSPGLNVDIAFITAFHTRFVLDAIARTLPERPKFLPPIEKNYLVWGNRPVHPFTKHFELQRIQVASSAGLPHLRQRRFRMKFHATDKVRLLLPKAALQAVFDECDGFDQDETGGRVIGTFQEHGGKLASQVTGIIEAGPQAAARR